MFAAGCHDRPFFLYACSFAVSIFVPHEKRLNRIIQILISLFVQM